MDTISINKLGIRFLSFNKEDEFIHYTDVIHSLRNGEAQEDVRARFTEPFDVWVEYDFYTGINCKEGVSEDDYIDGNFHQEEHIGSGINSISNLTSEDFEHILEYINQ